MAEQRPAPKRSNPGVASASNSSSGDSFAIPGLPPLKPLPRRRPSSSEAGESQVLNSTSPDAPPTADVDSELHKILLPLLSDRNITLQLLEEGRTLYNAAPNANSGGISDLRKRLTEFVDSPPRDQTHEQQMAQWTIMKTLDELTNLQDSRKKTRPYGGSMGPESYGGGSSGSR